MRHAQSGFVDRAGSGLVPTIHSDPDHAVSFRFVVTWSWLLQAADPPKALTPAFPAAHAGERPRARAVAPRALPAPQAQATPLSQPARTYAGQVVPADVKKSRPAPGFQWEMVVPKMVRAAKKTVAPDSRRADPAFAQTSAPNLYLSTSSLRKSFSFKLCAGVAALAAISVPLWKHAARPAATQIETPVDGGDWLRARAILGDPGVKQFRQLVLFKPALKATNYRFEFDWTVASGDVGLVFRAKDLGNYYAVRLKVLKPGSSPTLAADYFSVYHFVESSHNEKVIVFSRNDPVLHVRLEVFGPMFTLYLQNNATEYWTDAQMGSGAMGFLEEWNRGAQVSLVRISFPQRSQSLGAPVVTDEPRILARARDTALGGV